VAATALLGAGRSKECRLQCAVVKLPSDGGGKDSRPENPLRQAGSIQPQNFQKGERDFSHQGLIMAQMRQWPATEDSPILRRVLLLGA
jgi:hypothetical protein